MQSFTRWIDRALSGRNQAFRSLAADAEFLSELNYDEELTVKNTALSAFWKANGLDGEPERIVASPLSRHYRVTTKRRVAYRTGGISFLSGDRSPAEHRSALEPESHGDLYAWLERKLSLPVNGPLSRVLNWLVIRGNYTEQTLIFNVFYLDAAVVRRVKALAEELRQNKIAHSAWLYADPSRSDYYLEAQRPETGVQIKHLFGPRLLKLRVGDLTLKYAPTVFSQVNESMIPLLVAKAGEILKPTAEDFFLDLYCGYGLFSHTIGRACARVYGLELSAEAVRSAREIARRQEWNHMRFDAAPIDASTVRRLSAPGIPEKILLDPPRQGTVAGVLEGLAARRPRSVLHIHCGVDEIPRELARWRSSGYRVKRVVPLDMFAGSANLEILIGLEHASLQY